MSLSYSQELKFECSVCGAPVTGQAWIAIDSEERPDLWAQCRNGSLNLVTCPNQHPSELKAPVFLHDGVRKQIYFFVVDTMSMEENEEIQKQLLMHLEKAFDARARNEEYQLAHHISVPVTASALTVEASSSDAASRAESLRRQEFILTLEDIYLRSESDTSLRAALCKETLSSLNRDEEPLHWAALQALLGNSLFHSESGEESENLELAIKAYEDAIAALTPDMSPEYWGLVHLDLGVAYNNRSLGDPADNVESAIHSFEEVLRVYTRENEPDAWADTSAKLGDQYRRRAKGEEHENIRKAIRHYEAALSVYTHESAPADWAYVQTGIGKAYAHLMDNNRPQSIDRSIGAMEASLRFYNPQDHPEQWASAQRYLANLYSQRLNGDSKTNLDRAVTACEGAFTIYKRDSFPFEWADLHTIQGICLLKRATDPTSVEFGLSEILENAIRAFESALEVFTPENHPAQWMSALGNLATAYQERVYGDEASNVEHAIHLYEHALAIIDKQKFPAQWATAQVNLADAYTKRTGGSANENLRKALTAYEATTTNPLFQGEELFAKAQVGILTAFSSQDEERNPITERLIRVCEASLKTEVYNSSPEKWAATQVMLAGAYMMRLGGNRVDNIERALKACRAALTVFTPESALEEWTHAQIILADIYQELPSGVRADNIEESIRIYQESLAVLSESSPKDWARVQLQLGIALIYRVYESRADNIELSIKACERALSVFSYEQDPEHWASGQLNLGLAYYTRICGLRDENIEAAISAFQLALSVYTRETSPGAWAVLQNNLGNAYTDRIQGSRADNIEKAINAFELALEGHLAREDHQRWAGAQTNLGATYLQRTLGERADNLERAIKAFKAALTIFTPQAHPVDWAKVQTNLGAAYIKRIIGDEDENVDLAIQSLEAALAIGREQVDPADWAGIHLNLASAYLSRSERDEQNIEDQELALKACEAAMSFFTLEDFPEQWLILQSQLSRIYLVRVQGNRADSLERSIKIMEAALTDSARMAFPDAWATLQFQLGNAYADRIVGDQNENLGRAVQAYEAALEIHRPAESPEAARRTALQLGKVLKRQDKWEEAYAAFLIALQAAEQLYSTAVSSEGKAAEILGNVLVYRSLVEACLRLTPARPHEAFQYAEQSRARILREQLGGLNVPPPAGIPEALLKREQSLRHTLRGLTRAAEVSSDETMRQIWVEETETALTDLRSVWNTMIQDHQAANYVALRSGLALRWDEIQAWLLNQTCEAAALEFVTLQDRIIVFIIRKGEAEPRVVEIELSTLKLLDFAQRLLNEVSNYDADEPCKETWGGLALLLLPEIMPNLEGAELVYIVSDLVLHYLPLHALEYEGKPLISYFPMVYVPSIASAIRIRDHSSTPGQAQAEDLTRRFLVVGNPTGDLAFAEEEAKEVAQQLGVRPLLGNEATVSRVQSRMANKDLVHFATHAYFHPVEPFASGIILANGHVLTAEHVLSESLGVELLVLSGCETGRQHIGPGNELAGLANTFLYAGVSSLILSQWPVNDAVTARLMKRVYHRLYDSKGVRRMTPAEALRGAMLETRAENPHVYHWAPFFLFGR